MLYVLPWQGRVLAGTTDRELSSAERSPRPTTTDVSFILAEMNRYMKPAEAASLEDVRSAWCGIRPLAVDPHKARRVRVCVCSAAELTRVCAFRRTPALLPSRVITRSACRPAVW